MNTNKSVIAQAIVGNSSNMGEFKPSKEFYQKTGIRQKRFGQLYRGEKSPKIEEIKAISYCLNIPTEKFGLMS
jgi:hypothetical protein